MAEEHRCQAPRLCVNNCGFFGSPATQDLCSKCFRDLQLKEQQSSNAKFILRQSLIKSSSSSTAAPKLFSFSRLPSESVAVSSSSITEEKTVATAQPNRCLTCRRRVGLTGFKCRCGSTFCGSHRYPEKHGCEFDFKEMGREQIAKANPVVMAEKLRKI